MSGEVEFRRQGIRVGETKLRSMRLELVRDSVIPLPPPGHMLFESIWRGYEH